MVLKALGVSPVASVGALLYADSLGAEPMLRRAGFESPVPISVLIATLPV